MDAEKRIVVVGSHVQGLFMRVDHFPTADETVLGWGYREALDGGKGSHQAIACGRLGVATSFVGRVGNDRLGDTGAGWMRDAGVDLRYLVKSEKTATGVGFIMIRPDGVPAITTAMGANAELCEADIDAAEELIARSSLMLVTFEIPSRVALYATRVAHRHGLTVLLTPGPAERLEPADLEGVDILVPNEPEAKTLLGLNPELSIPVVELAERCLRFYGLDRVVMTVGAEGAVVADGGVVADRAVVADVERVYQVPSVPVDVLDTPGAGDAFTAGLATTLARGCSLEEAVRVGCLAGAHAVTVRESVPSFATLAQLREFATAHGQSLPFEQVR